MENKTLSNIYLFSFYDTLLTPSAKRLFSQAKGMDIFNNIYFYNENTLPEDFKIFIKKHIKNKFPPKGYGYWSWKPRIILDVFDKINYGDILVYIDVGWHLNKKAKKRFEEYIDTVIKNDALTVYTKFLERVFMKSDLFNYFNVLGNRDIIDTNQRCGTFLILKKTDKNISIVKKWSEVFYYDFSLLDDTPSEIENAKDFYDHRHDQSIFSCLSKLNNIYSIDDKDFETNIDGENNPVQFRRDKVKVGDIENPNLKKVINKIAWFIPNKSLRDSFRYIGDKFIQKYICKSYDYNIF